MCWCWPFADAWLEDPPAPAPPPPSHPAPPPPPSEKTEYEYVSIPCPCGCKPPSVVLPLKAPKMPGSDYEHWPADPQLAAIPDEPAPRYDSRNGMRERTYRPAGEIKKAAEEVKKEEVVKETVQVQHQWAGPWGPMMGYGYGGGMQGQMPWPYESAPAPAYYGYPPAAAPAPPEKEQKPTAERPRKWQGRTRAEVEEDDMRLAASENAYAPRKVAPVRMADDQMVWVVNSTGEGGSSLRAYAEVKEMKGEWKADPRFKDAWFFVKEAVEVEGEEAKK